MLERIPIAIKEASFHKDINTVIVSLMYKKGKDTNLCTFQAHIKIQIK